MRRRGLAATACWALAALAACGGEGARPKGPTRGIRLPGGGEVAVPLRPERIVSTLPGITEMVADLGGAGRLVAVSPHCDRPESVRSLPRVAVLPLSLEAIAAHRPDVILVDGTLLRVSLPDLRRRFGAVVPLDSRSLDGLAGSYGVLADLLATDEARERADAFRRDLDLLRIEVSPRNLGARPRVLLVGQPEPLHVLGPGSLLDDMVRAAGAENVAFDLGRASGPFAMESVRERAPDWILTVGSPLPDALRRAWADLPAVRDGRVADASADDLVRAGPRTPDALRRLAQVLRGERAPEGLSPRDGGSR